MLSPIMALALLGCQSKDQTFLSIDVCLGHPSEVPFFKDALRSIAQTEGMIFVDGSAQTNAELKSIGAQRFVPQPFVNVGINDNDGNIMMGGNLGLTNRQVALGFRGGKNATGDRAFAERTVSALRKRWRVEIVPEGKGSFPTNGC